MVLSSINPLYQTMNYPPAPPYQRPPTNDGFLHMQTYYANQSSTATKTDYSPSPFHLLDCRTDILPSPGSQCQSTTIGFPMTNIYSPSCVYGPKTETTVPTSNNSCGYYPNFNLPVHQPTANYYQPSSFSRVLSPMQEFPWMKNRQPMINMPSITVEQAASNGKQRACIFSYCPWNKTCPQRATWILKIWTNLSNADSRF